MIPWMLGKKKEDRISYSQRSNTVLLRSISLGFYSLPSPHPVSVPMRVALSVRESHVFMGFFAAFPRKLFFLFLVNLPSFLGHNLNWAESQGSHNFPKCKYIDPYVLLSRAKWTNKARNSGIKDV